MTNSQLFDLGVSNKQLGIAIQETERLKSQVEVNLKLSSKIAEEIATYQRMKKRIRTASYVELGIGVPCLALGLLPIWTDEQKNIQNLLLGVGATSTVAGAVNFTFTITF